MKLLDDFQLGVRETLGGGEDGGVGVPFKQGLGDEGRAADGDLADGGAERGLRADGAEEGVPACGGVG